MKRKNPTWLNDPDCYAAGCLGAIRAMMETAPPGFNKEIFLMNLILQLFPPQVPMVPNYAKTQTEKN